MKEFTEEELARYNGRNATSAYVAYDGKVYDVSSSFLWRDGVHEVFHSAGSDLTDALKQAPHDAEALLKFPVVGIVRKTGMPSLPSER